MGSLYEKPACKEIVDETKYTKKLNVTDLREI